MKHEAKQERMTGGAGAREWSSYDEWVELDEWLGYEFWSTQVEAEMDMEAAGGPDQRGLVSRMAGSGQESELDVRPF